MSTWVAWRLLKFLGVVWFAGGIVGSITSRHQDDRIRAAQLLTALGFLATWIAGYEMMKLTGRSLEPWILCAMAASLLALHGSLMYAHKAVPRLASAGLAFGGLVGSLFPMVLRPSTGLSAFGMGVAAAVIGGIAAAAFAAKPEGGDDRAAGSIRTWLHRVAFLEGASLILLTLVSMPLKYGLGIAIDGGGGRLGWVHGVIVLVFTQALLSGGRALGWSWRKIGLAFITSMLPFGTFWFMARRAGRDG